MAVFNIKETLNYDIKKVWCVVTDVKNYNWRSDLSHTEVINDVQFVEYTANNYPTLFNITNQKEYEIWEFDIDNSNIKGHWTGKFNQIGNRTEIDFTEEVFAKKFFMKPLLKSFIKSQQQKFISDLKKALSE